MADPFIDSPEGLTLLGGGEVGPDDLSESLTIAPKLVCADGGAAAALAAGLTPDAVIGDLDSLPTADAARLAPGTLHRIAEQDSTDFDKVLTRIRAPFALGVGFLGRRIDHQLANLNSLVRTPLPCLLLGAQDCLFAAPPEIALALPPETRVSLFPLTTVTGRSEGLHWPIDGLTMDPGGLHGTSNRVAAAATQVQLAFDGPGQIVIMPRAVWGEALRALRAAPPWPAPAP